MDGSKLTGDADAKKKQPQAKAPESDYSLEELIAGHKAFNVPKEIATVALKLKKIERATFAEAKKIIDEFKNREVK